MGSYQARRPKLDGLEVRKYHNPPYGELEDEVKDVILSGKTTDPVLDFLIALTITDLVEGQQVTNLLAEPHFYREYFRRWVREGLEERRKIDESDKQVLEKMKGIG